MPSSLGLSEDIVTEACRIAASLEFPENCSLEELSQKLSVVLDKSDDLSPCVEYIVKALCKLKSDRLKSTGVTVPWNIGTFLKLLFHKLNTVREDLYKTINLIEDFPTSTELFCVASQAVILETKEASSKQTIIAEAFKLLSRHLHFKDMASRLLPQWCEFVSQLQPRDFSFMQVFTFTEGEDTRLVYSFVDSEYEGDLYTKAYLEFKQFLRVKNLAKLCKMFGVVPQGSDSFVVLLRLLMGYQEDYEQLLGYSGESPQASMRVKAVASAKLIKAVIKGRSPWPQKLTPLLQALGTSYKVTPNTERRSGLAETSHMQSRGKSNSGA